MCSKIRKDKIQNECFQEHLGEASKQNKIRKTPFEIVWICPTLANNDTGKEKLDYVS